MISSIPSKEKYPPLPFILKKLHEFSCWEVNIIHSYTQKYSLKTSRSHFVCTHSWVDSEYIISLIPPEILSTPNAAVLAVLLEAFVQILPKVIQNKKNCFDQGWYRKAKHTHVNDRSATLPPGLLKVYTKPQRPSFMTLHEEILLIYYTKLWPDVMS